MMVDFLCTQQVYCLRSNSSLDALTPIGLGIQILPGHTACSSLNMLKTGRSDYRTALIDGSSETDRSRLTVAKPDFNHTRHPRYKL